MKTTKTKNDLIKYLQQLAKELGRSPRLNEVKNPKAIYTHFESYNHALEAAKLQVNCEKRTDENVIKAFKEKVKELKYIPTPCEFHLYKELTAIFGSKENAINELGFAHLMNAREDLKKTELLNQFNQLVKESGTVPKAGKFSLYRTLLRNFGTYPDAIEAAKVQKKYFAETKTKDALIEKIRETAVKSEQAPTPSLMANSYAAIRGSFKSFEDAVKLALDHPDFKKYLNK